MTALYTRYASHPEGVKEYTTRELRKNLLIEKIFEPGKVHSTYTHNDRMIFGGVTPTHNE